MCVCVCRDVFVAQWLEELKEHCPNTPFLLCGTKADLRDDEATIANLKANNEVPITRKRVRVFPTLSLSSRAHSPLVLSLARTHAYRARSTPRRSRPRATSSARRAMYRP